MVDSVVCYLWNGDANLSRREFLPEYVNTLARMFRKHLHKEHRFICVADHSFGLDSRVEFVQTPGVAKEVGLLPSPEGPRFPSCYRRLWSWSKEAKDVLGERQLVIDIDLILTASVDHLFEQDEEFIGWRPYRDWGAKLRYGGGIYLLKSGTRSQVWENFQGQKSVEKARRHGYRGSDQAWISYCLCHNAEKPEVHWTQEAGIYSVRDLDRTTMALPQNACLVQFNGPVKPWQTQVEWAQKAWANHSADGD
jgi:hypothetical protein